MTRPVGLFSPYTITQLPQEVLVSIFSKLSFPDLLRTSCGCHQFLQIAGDNALWELLLEKDFSHRTPIANPSLSWKEQYQFAYLAESNLKQGKGRVSYFPLFHDSAIVCLKKRGEFLMSGSRDGKLVISHPEMACPQIFPTTGTGKFQVEGDDLFFFHQNGIKVLTKTPKEKEYQEIDTLFIAEDQICEADYETDRVYAVAKSGTLKVWEKDLNRKFKEIFTLEEVDFIKPKDGFLFLTTEQMTLEIWKKTNEGSFHKSQVFSATCANEFQFSDLYFEKGHLYAGCFDGSFNIWKMDKEGVFHLLQSHQGTMVDSLQAVTAYAVREGTIVLGSSKGWLQVFKKDETGLFQLVQDEQVHSDRINSIALQNNRMMTASTDGTYKIWLFKEGKFQVVVNLTRDEGITCAEIDGDCYIAGYANGNMEIFDFAPEISAKESLRAVSEKNA
jgi:WD40 repeat protein